MATPVCGECGGLVTESPVFALGVGYHRKCFWPNSPHLWTPRPVEAQPKRQPPNEMNPESVSVIAAMPGEGV